MEERGVGKLINAVSSVLNVIGGVALSIMMIYTVIDVIMRAIGKPITGTYEIVSLSLALVIFCGVPKVSLERGHIYMEFLVNMFPKTGKAIMNTFTRALCIILFVLMGSDLLHIGNEFHRSGEVTPTLQLPFFPVAYIISVCCFIEVLVLVLDVVKVWRGQYE